MASFFFIFFYVLIFPVGITVALILLPVFKQGVTTFTTIVSVTLFFLSLPAVMIGVLGVSKVTDDDDGVSHKTKVENKEDATSPSTSQQTKVVAVEPRTFSNLPIRTKTVNNIVTSASSSNK